MHHSQQRCSLLSSNACHTHMNLFDRNLVAVLHNNFAVGHHLDCRYRKGCCCQRWALELHAGARRLPGVQIQMGYDWAGNSRELWPFIEPTFLKRPLFNGTCLLLTLPVTSSLTFCCF